MKNGYFFVVFKSFFILFCCLSSSSSIFAEEHEAVETSPKKAWGEFNVVEESTAKPIWAQVLLWPVNRVLDAVDVVRADIGFGFSSGGVVRLSKYGQLGYRSMNPASLRLGAFGRKKPFLVESSNEVGVGPSYVNSKDREVCTAEVGIGLDIFITGAYIGVCGEELVDFISGIFFLDTADDDIR